MDQPTQPAIRPTQPGPMVRAKPASNWPTVIGIIAMVFGGLGILGGAWGVVGTLMPGLFNFGVGQQAEMFEVMRQWATWNLMMAVIMAAVAAILLASGIKLLKRRPEAPRWCGTWAKIKIVLVIVTSIAGYMCQQEMFEAMGKAQGPGQAAPATFMKAAGLFGFVFGLLWGWALPVFMLIWFGQKKIKTETADWK